MIGARPSFVLRNLLLSYCYYYFCPALQQYLFISSKKNNSLTLSLAAIATAIADGEEDEGILPRLPDEDDDRRLAVLLAPTKPLLSCSCCLLLLR